ncbi:hypothetical protein BQ8482_340203 [Mesorhizobium delmotii]|uniref:DUF692 domain-containing protein n=2 Tax=Mesorhizobium delmotii TaxID=1631247 RepID=A0A2P9AQ69_9HYPH|nr:hypothetical protein BQ8482_340203 [Mesorhizobium delmotii]
MEQAASAYPVVAHGVGLSLGSASLPSVDYLNKVEEVLAKLGALNYSEHLAFTKSASLDSSQLLPVPRTPEARNILIENVASVQRQISLPFLIENITYYFDYAGPQMAEFSFISEIADATGCGILLDIENLYINSVNHKFSTQDFLSGLPRESVRAAHVAGGGEHNGVLIDTHDRPPREGTLCLLREVCSRWDLATIILERDEGVDDPYCIIEDLDLIRSGIHSDGPGNTPAIPG